MYFHSRGPGAAAAVSLAAIVGLALWVISSKRQKSNDDASPTVSGSATQPPGSGNPAGGVPPPLAQPMTPQVSGTDAVYAPGATPPMAQPMAPQVGGSDALYAAGASPPMAQPMALQVGDPAHPFTSPDLAPQAEFVSTYQSVGYSDSSGQGGYPDYAIGASSSAQYPSSNSAAGPADQVSHVPYVATPSSQPSAGMSGQTFLDPSAPSVHYDPYNT
jgi:hypothetical protein